MDHRIREIISLEELQGIRQKVLDNVELTVRWIRSLDERPMSLFQLMRFRPVGHDPLLGTALNFVEQLNRTFAILASLRATELLFKLHPEVKGYRLALGNASGRAIESLEKGCVAAEVFCATHPGSNQKARNRCLRSRVFEFMQSTWIASFAQTPQHCMNPELPGAPGLVSETWVPPAHQD